MNFNLTKRGLALGLQESVEVFIRNDFDFDKNNARCQLTAPTESWEILSAYGYSVVYEPYGCNGRSMFGDCKSMTTMNRSPVVCCVKDFSHCDTADAMISSRSLVFHHKGSARLAHLLKR